MPRHLSYLFLSLWILALLAPVPAHALPAFARRYNVDCTTCHTNPPRLNNYGIAFMRRGFKMSWEEKLDGQKLQEYESIQATIDAASVHPNVPEQTLAVTQLALLTAGPLSRQLSYYGELDYDPVGLQTSVHEARAIILFPQKLSDDGKESYYSLSVGAIRPFSTWQKGLTETQTIDSPLIFSAVPVNGLSFVPDNPQYGIEFGYNQSNLQGYGHGTYATVALLGGLNVNAQTSIPEGLSPLQNDSLDVEAQLAHYFGPRNSVSLMYYSGTIRFNPNDLPGGVSNFPFVATNGFVNSHYSRVYLNGNWSPNKYWDFLAGGMVGNDSTNPVDGTSTPSNGAYLEANYYLNPKYVAAVRYDTFNLDSNVPGSSLNDFVLAVKGQLLKNVFLTIEHNGTNNNDGSHTDTNTAEIRVIW